MQGASVSAYWWICAGGCNAADGPKDKPDGVCIFCRGPNTETSMQDKPNVLIVDDDPGMCRSLKALLGNNGCILETINSGEEALKRLNSTFFDLVLVDLYIREMSGFQIIDYINGQSPDTFVIVITGNSSESTAIEAIRKGAYDYIKKPFEPEKMINTVGNVLQQRKLIKERNQALETLRESEQRMKAILRASPVGIGLAMNRTINWANETLSRMLGYQSEELMGRTARILYQDDNEYERVGRQLYTESSRTEPATVETQWVRKDREILDCMLFSCPLDPQDASKGYIVAANDTSEFRRFEAQLQRAQKMEAIGTLAGGVAHDLNNILTGLVSYPELLLMQMSIDNPLRKPLFTIQKSGEKAAVIVQDLLTLARRGVAANDLLNINEIVSQYLISPEYRSLKSSYPDIEVACELSEEIPNVMGSEAHLSKTLMNLVVNAAEAIPEGGKIVVSTQVQHLRNKLEGYEDIMPGHYVVLKVSDTGTGISQKDIKKIFEPFYTKKKMGRSGTGLGMAVVWSSVKDHKGYVNVESAEGKGSVFTLYFPATPVSEVKDEPVLKIENYYGKGESVLVIDDIKEQREVASQMLKHLGYQPSTVSSGEEAVEYLRDNRVDLLVLDMIMDPGMDGLETYKKIIELHPGQKAVIASGYSETDRVREVQRLGAGPYVKKPFLLEVLGKAIKQELSR
jgi:two-component system cell cycle sensor histidine kinase/response regulator CckA